MPNHWHIANSFVSLSQLSEKNYWARCEKLLLFHVFRELWSKNCLLVSMVVDFNPPGDFHRQIRMFVNFASTSCTPSLWMRGAHVHWKHHGFPNCGSKNGNSGMRFLVNPRFQFVSKKFKVISFIFPCYSCSSILLCSCRSSLLHRRSAGSPISSIQPEKPPSMLPSLAAQVKGESTHRQYEEMNFWRRGSYFN